MFLFVDLRSTLLEDVPVGSGQYHRFRRLDHRLVVQVLVVTIEPLTKRLISVLEIVLHIVIIVLISSKFVLVVKVDLIIVLVIVIVVLIFAAGFVIFLFTLSTIRKTKPSSNARHLSFLFLSLCNTL